MNSIHRTLAFVGANLVALASNASDTTTLKPVFSGSAESNHRQIMSDEQMRTIEASHLEVYAGCKWGHAAFDPVQVESEDLSPVVQSIYAEMAQA